MKVHIYLKGGQQITLDHITTIETTKNTITGEMTSYSFKHPDLPAKAVKLHTLMMDEVAAITTEGR